MSLSKIVTMRRVERIKKCQLGWLKAHVENYTDKGWHAQVTAAIQRCIDAYDDVEEGYVVEYHRKVIGGSAAGRQFALCGMQSLYKPFRAAIARATAHGLGHPELPPHSPLPTL